MKKREIPINFKKVYVTTYGLQTMAITQKQAEERAVLGISLRHKITNVEIRQKRGITDITKRVAEPKLQWVEHVARQDRER